MRRWCTTCVEALEPGARELERRARAAQALLAGCVGYYAVGFGWVRVAYGETAQAWIDVLGVVQLGAAGAFAWWFAQAVRCAEALGISVGASPTNAAASWFIPGVNLVLPFRYAARLAGPGSGRLLLTWLACWGGGLVSQLLRWVGVALWTAADRGFVDDDPSSSSGLWLARLDWAMPTVWLSRSVLLFSAAGLAALAVRALTSRLVPDRRASDVWDR